MGENRLVLFQQQIFGKEVVCFYTVEGPWKELFPEPHIWSVHYTEFMAGIPKCLMPVPFLGAFLPLALLCEAEIEVPLCEEGAAEWIGTWQQELAKKYPERAFAQSTVIYKTEKAKSPEVPPRTSGERSYIYMEESALLDTMIREAGEFAEVLQICGEYRAGKPLDQVTREGLRLEKLSAMFGLKFRRIQALFAETLDEQMRELLAKEPRGEELRRDFCEMASEALALPYLWKMGRSIFRGSVRSEEERVREIQSFESRTGIRLHWDSLPAEGRDNSEMIKPHGDYPPYLWMIATPDHSNLGDHQIVESMREFLRDLAPDTRIQEVYARDYERRKEELVSLIRPEDVLVFLGGGFFCNLWPKGDLLRRDAFRTWPENRKVVFPQSLFFTEDSAGQEALEDSQELYRGDKTLLVFRDPVSYEKAKELFDCPMLLTPDIVMYSDKQRYAEKERKGALLLLRADQERTLPEGAEREVEKIVGEHASPVRLSDMAEKSVDPQARQAVLDRKFRQIASAEVVVTDRLHGLLFCVITGTPCVVFGNVYHKIAAYQSWLAEIPYVTMASALSELPQALERVMRAEPKTYPAEKLRQAYGELQERMRKLLLDAEQERRSKKAEERPLVSVIVPAYNEGKYLRECLDSLLAQTYRALEILCINDGSTDDTQAILEEYEGRDSRIRVFSQENAGLSVTRNRGMEQASGTYLCFLDSDDALIPTAIWELVSRAEDEDLDLLFFDALPFHDGEDCTEMYEHYVRFYHRQFAYPHVYRGSTLMREMRSRREYLDAACLYMVRCSLLTENQITFVPGILHEDKPFTLEVTLCARRAAYNKKKYYLRRVAPGSITTSQKSFRNIEGFFLGYMEMIRFLDTREEFTEQERSIGLAGAEQALGMAQREYANLEDKNAWKQMPSVPKFLFQHLVVRSDEVLGRQQGQEIRVLKEKLERTYMEKAERGTRVRELEAEKKKWQQEEEKLLQEKEILQQEKEKLQQKKEKLLQENRELQKKAELLAKIRKSFLFRALRKLHLLP